MGPSDESITRSGACAWVAPTTQATSSSYMYVLVLTLDQTVIFRGCAASCVVLGPYPTPTSRASKKLSRAEHYEEK